MKNTNHKSSVEPAAKGALKSFLKKTTMILFGVVLCACGVQELQQTNYIPQPVLCADGSAKLCPVIPSFIGPDSIITKKSVGYSGLSNNVASLNDDVQTPFDNMSWQMFIALNWQASKPTDPKTALSGAGKTVWQSYSRPEDVFGGPAGSCANPGDLPRFNFISKSGGQGRTLDGFIEATGQPLIDVNGNWTLYERRLNDVEETYLKSNGLNTFLGQKKFALDNKKVDLPIGDMSKTDGNPGAIEVKASWRIIKEAEKASYFNLQGLIDVEGEFVRDGNPLCEEVTLGLVGLHIIQNNGLIGNLQPQFIWASFEHKDNAPLAKDVCDPVDPNCYKTISNNVCPASTDDKNSYSFHNPKCAGVKSNVPPVLPPNEKAFQWERTQPYARSYMTSSDGESCGTQVVRCWQVYKLTGELNTAWRKQLAAIDSVFANYFLIGTNWGGNVEPDGTQLTNGSVPAFLGNSTLETYIQADPKFGNCVGCHSNATLAYKKPTSDPKKPVTYSADFSFLLGLPQPCNDVNAGPILSNEQAKAVCPKVCDQPDRVWNGQWKTTDPGKMSVCGCCITEAPTNP